MVADLIFLLRVLVFPGFLFLFLFTLFCDWFERKVEARIENRIGPSYTGPTGLFQPLADFIKLITKAEIVPKTRRSIFVVMPLLAFSLFVFTVFFLPIDGQNVVSSVAFEGDLILVLALVSVATLAQFLAGWSSSNPFSGIGATRVLSQFLGYDIPLFLLALSPAFLARSLSIQTIALKQIFPFALAVPWVFLLFLLTIQAELERDPFDVPHAETEIVAGFETEFSGGRLAFLKLSKDVQLVLGAALAVELFLGGPYGPVLFGAQTVSYSLWFVLKVLLVIMISELLTAVFARLRIDSVMNFGWKILLPLSLSMLVLTAWLANTAFSGL